MIKNKSTPSHKKIISTGVIVLKDEKKAVRLNSPPLYHYFLENYSKIGDDISVVTIIKRPKRSESQNNFYHLYLSLITLSSGHTMSELKAWVCSFILGQGIKEVFGETVRVTKSTADLNISEFCEMMNIVYDQTEIPIPNPAPFKLPLTQDEYGHLKLIQTEEYRQKNSKLKKTK